MTRYPLELKQEMVKKLCSPNGPSAYQLSEETGISTGSLYKWLRKFSGEESVSKKSSSSKWTPEQKMEAVFHTKSLSEEQLGEYLRSVGLHSNTLDEWKEEMFSALSNNKKSPGRPPKDPELVALENENKQLKKDLYRKDRALAEQTAIIILQKKAEKYLWEEENE